MNKFDDKVLFILFEFFKISGRRIRVRYFKLNIFEKFDMNLTSIYIYIFSPSQIKRNVIIEKITSIKKYINTICSIQNYSNLINKCLVTIEHYEEDGV